MGLFGKSKKEKAAELMQSGLKGIGTVLSVQDTGMTVNDNPRVKMVFRVEPLDGSPAFDAEKSRVVSRVEIPRQGDRYPVWYDAQDPTTWAFATIADDNGRQTMRELFGDKAESFVGMGGAPAPPAPAVTAPVADPEADRLAQLQKLGELKAQGVLSDAEFEQQKARLLSGS